MADRRDRVLQEQMSRQVKVAVIAFDELNAAVRGQGGDVVALELLRVIVVEVVDHDDLAIGFGQQPLDQVAANKSCTAGDQNRHEAAPCRVSLIRQMIYFARPARQAGARVPLANQLRFCPSRSEGTTLMPYRKRASFVVLLAAAYWVLLFTLTHIKLSPPGPADGWDK